MDLTDVKDPITFYISEPIQTQFSAVGVFDRKDLHRIIKNGVKKYGSPKQIFEAACTTTLALINGEIDDNADNMKAVFVGNFLNFAGTQTAQTVINNKDFRNFGSIIYDNPHRTDGNEISMRPIALQNSDLILEPDVMALGVANYLIEDYEKHPDYFVGHQLEDLLKKLSEKYPGMMT